MVLLFVGFRVQMLTLWYVPIKLMVLRRLLQLK